METDAKRFLLCRGLTMIRMCVIFFHRSYKIGNNMRVPAGCVFKWLNGARMAIPWRQHCCLFPYSFSKRLMCYHTMNQHDVESLLYTKPDLLFAVHCFLLFRSITKSKTKIIISCHCYSFVTQGLDISLAGAQQFWGLVMRKIHRKTRR